VGGTPVSGHHPTACGPDAAVAALRSAGLVVDTDTGPRLHLRTSATATGGRTVVRSLASWTDSFDPFTEATGLSHRDTVLVPVPPSASSLFAFAVAHAAHLGASVEVLDHWSPYAAAEATARCTATHLTPPMLAAVLDRLPPGHRLRTAVVAGAATPERLRTRALALGVRVVDYYGAAELSFVAIRQRDGALRPFPGVEVDLRDGEVWVRSPYAAEGYLAGQDGPWRREGDWSTVGDHATQDERGLHVTGRGGAAVQVGGTTVRPDDVEAALRTLPHVVDVVVVGEPHPVLGEGLVAVVVTDGATSRQELHAAAAGLLRREHLPRRWHLVEALPLSPAGKVSRADVARALQEDRHAAAPPADPTQSDTTSVA
jgi:long-chain acyl-CoA synthetase